MGSLLKRLFNLVSLWGLGISLLSILGGSLNGCLWVVVVGAAIWQTFSEYHIRRNLPTVPETLSDLKARATGYCLLLRPFGAEGSIQLVRRRPISRPLRGIGPFNGLLPLVRDVLTVEQVIDLVIRPTMGIDTIAVTEPGLVVLPPGPTFCQADGKQWKRDVESLIVDASIVVLLLPPYRGYTPNVAWEIERCVLAGLVGRLAIVLPPGERLGSETSFRALYAMSEIFPEILNVPEHALVAVPTRNQEVLWWPREKPRKGRRADVAAYVSEFTDACEFLVKSDSKITVAGNPADIEAAG